MTPYLYSLDNRQSCTIHRWSCNRIVNFNLVIVANWSDEYIYYLNRLHLPMYDAKMWCQMIKLKVILIEEISHFGAPNSIKTQQWGFVYKIDITPVLWWMWPILCYWYMKVLLKHGQLWHNIKYNRTFARAEQRSDHKLITNTPYLTDCSYRLLSARKT